MTRDVTLADAGQDRPGPLEQGRYDAPVGGYDATVGWFDAPPLAFRDRFGMEAAGLLGLRRGGHVVDLACGSGAAPLPAPPAVGPGGRGVGGATSPRRPGTAPPRGGRPPPPPPPVPRRGRY